MRTLFACMIGIAFLITSVFPAIGQEKVDPKVLFEAKCGTCHKACKPNSAHATAPNSPRAAAQPINGGNPPGIAPTSVLSQVTRLRGV